MDEFSEYETGNEPVPERVTSAADFIVSTLYDPWTQGVDVVCSSCGGAGGFNEKGERAQPQATHFRKIPPVNLEPGEEPPEDPHPTLCYECGLEEDLRDARRREAKRRISELIPPLFEGKSLRDYTVPPGDAAALHACNSFRLLRRGGRSLFLHGTTGVGKTHLAMAIAQRELYEGKSVMVLEWSEFTGKLRSTFQSKYVGQSEAEIMRDLQVRDLVIVDDVGRGKFTEWAGEVLWRIVNSRHGHMRQVIITSNLPLEAPQLRVDEKNPDAPKPDLSRWLGAGGQRTCSRLAAMCDVLHVKGSDVREQMELLR